MTRTDDDELRELRRRAYGPQADIHLDAPALARLRELEDAANQRMPESEEPAVAEAVPSDDALQDDSGVDESRDDPAVDDESAIWRWIRALPRPRRSTVLIVVGALLVTALLATALVLVERVQTDPLQVGARQVARLSEDPSLPVPQIFVVDDVSDFVVAEEFHGLQIVIGPGVVVGSSAGDCMFIVVTEDLPKSETDGYNGRSFFGCSAGGFPAMIQLSIDETLPQELRSAFPEGTALQFVRDQANGEVVVFADR